jgi:hypothetical protein
MLEYDPRPPLDTAENTRPTLGPLESAYNDADAKARGSRGSHTSYMRR